MKNLRKSACLLLVAVILITCFNVTGVSAATVGQTLSSPETGWQRIDSTDASIAYSGACTWSDVSDSQYHGGSIRCTSLDKASGFIKFNFTGTKIRLIGLSTLAINYSSSIKVMIDGVNVGTGSESIDGVNYKLLFFEKTDLTAGEHYIQIGEDVSGSYTRYMNFDAVDIDSNGELKSFDSTITVSTPTPVPTATPTLTPTPTSTPTPSSGFNGNKAILAISMSNGSEKEFDMPIAEIEGFLAWYKNKADGVANTSPYFEVSKNYNIKPFLGRKEYIVFDKISSFEVKDYND